MPDVKPKLLVLDDQAQYCRSLARVLCGDYDVVQALSVEEAKQQVTSGVALILTDIRVSETDNQNRQGLAFVKWVRSSGCIVPIVAMSALDDSEIDHEAIAAGATMFLRKPIIISELRRVLGEMIATSDR